MQLSSTFLDDYTANSVAGPLLLIRPCPMFTMHLPAAAGCISYATAWSEGLKVDSKPEVGTILGKDANRPTFL